MVRLFTCTTDASEPSAHRLAAFYWVRKVSEVLYDVLKLRLEPYFDLWNSSAILGCFKIY